MSFLLVLRFIVCRQGRLPVKWTAYEALCLTLIPPRVTCELIEWKLSGNTVYDVEC